VGVLEVYSREPRRFTADEVRSLLTFASQASVGLKNAMLIEQAARRKNELNVLGDLSDRLITDEDLDAVCSDVLARVCDASNSDIGVFRIFTPDDIAIGYHGPSAVSAEVQHESAAIDAALLQLVDWVREYGGRAQIPSPSSPAGDIAAVAVPVRKPGGVTIGSIALARVSPGNEFDDDDRRFLETVANLFAARLA
jgi:GAF domain-containing protein